MIVAEQTGCCTISNESDSIKIGRKMFASPQRIWSHRLSITLTVLMVAGSIILGCSKMIISSEIGTEHYMTIKELEEFCTIPGLCGKPLSCEGKEARVKGYLDYINIFDKQTYPNLPHQKFRIFDGPNILDADNPWASYTECLEIYPTEGDLESMFKNLHKKRGLPLKLVYIKGKIRGFDAPTNIGCRRMIYLNINANDVLYEEDIKK